MQFDSNRWRSQLVVWVLSIAFVAVTALMIRTFLDYRAAAIALLINRDQQLTFLSAVRLRDELLKFSNSLTTLARMRELYQGDPAIQQLALQDSTPIREGIFDGGVMLLDNFGKVIAAEPGLTALVGQDWSDREYFRRMLTSSTVYFSNITQDRLDGSPRVVVSVPVLGEGGQFVGMLAGMMRLGESTISPLYATIVRLRLGQEYSSVYLLDGEGIILFDSAGDGVGRPYTSISLPDTVLERRSDALRTFDRNQREVITSFAPIPGTDWMLVVEDDWQMTTLGTRRYLGLLAFLLMLAMLLLAASVAVLIYQRNAGSFGDSPEEQNLQVARQIKETLLPDHLPVMPGWHLAVHYEPVAAIDGDFYDLLLLHDGRLMVAVGDINEVGVSVTTVLAITRSTLRGAARGLMSPGQAVARSNEYLCAELPTETHVACSFALLDPTSGMLQGANAGPLLPSHRAGKEVVQLQANGPFLGAKLGSVYAEYKTQIAPGEWVLFYNNGVPAIRNAAGEQFGYVRLAELINQEYTGGEALIEALLTALDDFAGGLAKMQSSMILVVLERLAVD